jgi:formylglycine-generating enzyme required for sulfatase activity
MELGVPDRDMRFWMESVSMKMIAAAAMGTMGAVLALAVGISAMAAPQDAGGVPPEPGLSGLSGAPGPSEPGGQVFKDCSDCPEMVAVPPGSFTMGSPDSEPDHSRSESPQHRVTIASRLAAGRYPVTFLEWDACVADGGCDGHRPSDEGWGRGRRPVINVSWIDAQAYVRWLAGRTGQPYRLLTEAEREYVTRAGTTTPFWWGSAITPDQANYDGTAVIYAGGGRQGALRGMTTGVGSFQPNPFGLYDVHGNVSEWVEDCFRLDYADAPADGSAWTVPGCGVRVRRGGSWINSPWNLRAAFRQRGAPAVRDITTGFRVARTIAP